MTQSKNVNHYYLKRTITVKLWYNFRCTSCKIIRKLCQLLHIVTCYCFFTNVQKVIIRSEFIYIFIHQKCIFSTSFFILWQYFQLVFCEITYNFTKLCPHLSWVNQAKQIILTAIQNMFWGLNQDAFDGPRHRCCL